MPPRLRWAVGILGLFTAWIPWLGLVLALVALASPGPSRPAIVRTLGWVALAFGIGGTAAFYALPRGSVDPGDPALDLLEERLQPMGNLEEKKRAP